MNRLSGTQAGLSLVEMMVAMTISSILLLGIFTVYIDSSKTSRLANSLARVQESGRIATDVMARDMRMVGFQGCADPDDVTMNIIANNPPTGSFFDSTLRGWEVADASWADGTEFDGTTIESRAVIGSDVLAVQRGESVEIELTGNMSANNANIQVQGPEVASFSQGQIVLISDCEAADLFRISSLPASNTWAHANNVNSDNRLSQAYTDSARIMKFSATVYFVADTGRDDARGNDIRALYRATNNLLDSATPSFQIDEIVEGVESMQIEYGELLPTGSVRYRSADQVGDMNNAITVRVGFLISDADGASNFTDTMDYPLPGETIVAASGAAAGAVTHPEDDRVRRTFVSTVMLRNRD